jgi:cyclic pyranopterin phosphate synthase
MFSHVDKRGRPHMVDVGEKAPTRRTAHAVAVVELPREIGAALRDGEIVLPKGALLQTARLAGIMGAKKTSELIPLCHPLHLDRVHVDIELTGPGEATIHCRAEATERTGVEMEALTGAVVAALTLYDMAKSLSHGIVIRDVRLVEKTGGKRDWSAPAAAAPAARPGRRKPRRAPPAS